MTFVLQNKKTVPNSWQMSLDSRNSKQALGAYEAVCDRERSAGVTTNMDSFHKNKSILINY